MVELYEYIKREIILVSIEHELNTIKIKNLEPGQLKENDNKSSK